MSDPGWKPSSHPGRRWSAALRTQGDARTGDRRAGRGNRRVGQSRSGRDAGKVERLEFQRMFAGEMDPSPCFIDIQAGSGGTEAQDWAEMLLRMYLRWAERRGWKYDLVEVSSGDVAGIKSATFISPVITPMAGAARKPAFTAWCVSPRSTPVTAGTRLLPQCLSRRKWMTTLRSTSTRRISGGCLPRFGRRRAARQHDRFRGPDDPCADRSRGSVPE